MNWSLYCKACGLKIMKSIKINIYTKLIITSIFCTSIWITYKATICVQDNYDAEITLNQDYTLISNFNKSNKQIYHNIVLKINGKKIFLRAMDLEFYKNFKLTSLRSLPTPLPYIKEIKSPCFFAVNLTIYSKAPEIKIDHGNFTNKHILSEAGVQLHCLPYLYVVGFEKCATTDFYRKLTYHQDMYTPMKELLFWHFRARKMTLNEYSSLNFEWISNTITETYINFLAFKTSHDNGQQKLHKDYHILNTVLADFTPSTIHNTDPSYLYSDLPPAVESIHRITPHARIIILLRDPIEKVVSMYNYYVSLRKGNTSVSALEFHELTIDFITWWKKCRIVNKLSERQCVYLRDIPQKLQSNITEPNRWQRSFYRAMYVIFIEHWMEYFKKTQISFVNYRQYSSFTKYVLDKQVLPYLGLRQYNDESKSKLVSDINKGRVYNRRTVSTEIWNETRQILTTLYHPYNVRLRELTSINL